ncbi:hypothetical protein CEXT_554551 [Caerostris extrusa]|uniref:Uncharacterized protein n=1 Tax=Caerostris extrusa TaxID=172846 RepID=A0AAV4XN72_CAEEX|nr:hypothetical protein CEXT_554551 [Caerostris extrusa]
MAHNKFSKENGKQPRCHNYLKVHLSTNGIYLVMQWELQTMRNSSKDFSQYEHIFVSSGKMAAIEVESDKGNKLFQVHSEVLLMSTTMIRG